MFLFFFFFFTLLLKVANLRQRFFHSIAPGGLAGDRRGVVPASGFSFSAQQIWKVIKENKDLDLPAHKVRICLILISATLLRLSVVLVLKPKHVFYSFVGYGCHCSL